MMSLIHSSAYDYNNRYTGQVSNRLLTSTQTTPVYFGKRKPKEPPANRDIAYVELNGQITDQSVRALFDNLDQVEKLKFPALILRINSPGGASGTSEELYERLTRLRQQGTKIISSVGNIAASGGFLAASASNQIVAPGMALTGSIGAILNLRSIKGTLEKLGIQQKNYTAGEFKDVDLDELLAEDAKQGDNPGPQSRLFSELVQNQHDQFIRKVLEGRNGSSSEQGKAMTEEALRKVADGRILSGEQAFQLGLVDRIGGLPVAIDVAKELIENPDARVIPIGRPPAKKGLFPNLFDLFKRASGLTSSLNALNEGLEQIGLEA